jgi:hypothetical protein
VQSHTVRESDLESWGGEREVPLGRCGLSSIGDVRGNKGHRDKEGLEPLKGQGSPPCDSNEYPGLHPSTYCLPLSLAELLGVLCSPLLGGGGGSRGPAES